MLIVLIAEKRIQYSGFGLTILEYSRIVYYSELPIPILNQFFSLYQIHTVLHCCPLMLISLIENKKKRWFNYKNYYKISKIV